MDPHLGRQPWLADEWDLLDAVDEVDSTLDCRPCGQCQRDSHTQRLFQPHMGLWVERIGDRHDRLFILHADGNGHELAGRIHLDQSDGFRIQQGVVEIDVQHADPFCDRLEEIFFADVPAIDEELGDRDPGRRLLFQETLQAVFREQPTIDEELAESA